MKDDYWPGRAMSGRRGFTSGEAAGAAGIAGGEARMPTRLSPPPQPLAHYLPCARWRSRDALPARRRPLSMVECLANNGSDGEQLDNSQHRAGLTCSTFRFAKRWRRVPEGADMQPFAVGRRGLVSKTSE